MTGIRSLTRESVIKVIYCCLLLLKTVQSDSVHTKLSNGQQGSSEVDRHTSENSVTLASSSVSVAVKDGGCGESWCSSFNDNELLALEAIRSLHRQIDDDKNGNIDFDESDEFLREELKYEGDYENRQKKFHQNDDNHISVKELWESWVQSEVHNWTIAQTAEWLSMFVGLPQYSQNFLDNSVNGSFLPRLAINHHQVLSSQVGIKDLIHKQKIALKAQDVVLFGSPKEYGNRTKDSILTTLLVLALIVCWCVYSRYKLSQRDLNKMIKDMESLAKAEQALMDLQKELEKARTAQQEKAVEEELFKKSLDDGIPSSEEITRLKGEVEVLRNELQRAEVELQDKCWVPPPALQHWLQLTYELELKSYNKKKQSAEKQLKQAKDACDKLKKKRSSLMGAFVSTHGRSIDDVDKAILEARTALTEITQELQERMHRWKQIELLVNCPIMNNPGLNYLENVLRGFGRGNSFVGMNGPGSVISNSQDDIDDDGASSIYCPSAVHKLVSTSMCLMYPGGHETSFRVLPSLSEDATCSEGYTRKSQQQQAPTIPPPPPHLNSASIDSGTPESAVSAPGSGSVVHMPIMRSKSVSSMISLRDKGVSRECSSKDSSTGEEEMSTETSDATNGRDRRVTFGIRTDHRESVMTVTQQRQLNKEKREEGKTPESNIVTCSETTIGTLGPGPGGVVPPAPNCTKKEKESRRLWKKLSRSLHRPPPPSLNTITTTTTTTTTNTTATTPTPINNKLDHLLPLRNNVEESPNMNKPTFISWSRRTLLKSPWRFSQGKDRILLQMIPDK